jgi:WD40 repeat protein
VWSLTGGAHREFPGHQAGVGSFTVLDDHTVVSYGDDGTALSWDPRSGRNVTTEPLPRPHPVGAEVVVRMAGPRGHQEVTGDVEGTIRVRDSSTGTTVQTFRGPGGPIISLATTADGVLGGCVSGVLSSWGLDSPKLRWERRAHTSLLTGIVVAGDRVVTGGADGFVRMWRITDGEPLGTLAELGQPIGTIAVRHDGDQLVIAAGERLIILDIAAGAVVATFYGDARISALAVLSDGGIVCGEAAGAVHFLTLLSG